MQMLDVDQRGFDSQDRRLLATIIEKFDGGPVGLGTLAAAVGEDAGTYTLTYTATDSAGNSATATTNSVTKRLKNCCKKYRRIAIKRPEKYYVI